MKKIKLFLTVVLLALVLLSAYEQIHREAHAQIEEQIEEEKETRGQNMLSE